MQQQQRSKQWRSKHPHLGKMAAQKKPYNSERGNAHRRTCSWQVFARSRADLVFLGKEQGSKRPFDPLAKSLAFFWETNSVLWRSRLWGARTQFERCGLRTCGGLFVIFSREETPPKKNPRTAHGRAAVLPRNRQVRAGRWPRTCIEMPMPCWCSTAYRSLWLVAAEWAAMLGRIDIQAQP